MVPWSWLGSWGLGLWSISLGSGNFPEYPQGIVSLGLKVRGILNHGGGQAEIDNAIKEYLQRFSDANPKILRIIADKMQGKPTTEQG